MKTHVEDRSFYLPSFQMIASLTQTLQRVRFGLSAGTDLFFAPSLKELTNKLKKPFVGVPCVMIMFFLCKESHGGPPPEHTGNKIIRSPNLISLGVCQPML